MFGYVRPSNDRLTEEERQTFQAAYCGLCHTLGKRYGAAGRMILNYDLTFLAMLLSEGGGTCEKRCAVHPVRKRRCACSDAAMDVAADMSVILTWWQVQDGIADHDAEWNFLKGVICTRRGWLDEARQYFQTAVQMDPDDPEYQQALDMAEGRQSTYRPAGYGSVTTGGCDNTDCLRLCGISLCCNALGVPVCFC